MKILRSLAITAAVATISITGFATGLAQAAPNCEITKCRSGGRINTCWASMSREARGKAKSCDQIVIGSGQSAYAMALSLPRACIRAGAIIKIHRPYLDNFKAVPVGSRWHNFYFNRIKSSAVTYFKARGGMRRSGLSNAMFMVEVPAARTGLPICDRL